MVASDRSDGVALPALPAAGLDLGSATPDTHTRAKGKHDAPRAATAATIMAEALVSLYYRKPTLPTDEAKAWEEARSKAGRTADELYAAIVLRDRTDANGRAFRWTVTAKPLACAGSCSPNGLGAPIYESERDECERWAQVEEDLTDDLTTTTNGGRLREHAYEIVRAAMLALDAAGRTIARSGVTCDACGERKAAADRDFAANVAPRVLVTTRDMITRNRAETARFFAAKEGNG